MAIVCCHRSSCFPLNVSACAAIDGSLRSTRSQLVSSLLYLGLIILVLSLAFPHSLPAAEKEDIYLSLYVLGSLVQDKNVLLQGTEVLGTTIQSGIGAGVKAGIFPEFTRRMLGIELEYFGHGASVAFPVLGSPGTIQSANSNLIVLASMVNLFLRYPGAVLQPYGGVGLGYSSGVLHGTDIPGRADKDLETTPSFAYQFVAGLQGNVNERLFLFSEYKYFVANYHWSTLSLDFRAQYVVGGMGIRF